YGLKVWARAGFGITPLIALPVAVVLGVAFIRRQHRLADPLIDLKLFRVPTFRVSLVTFTLTTLVLFGSYIYIGQYLQLVRGASPSLRAAAEETLGGANAAAASIGGPAGEALAAAARDGFVHTFATIAAICAVVAGATLATAFVLLRKKRATAPAALPCTQLTA